MLNNFRNFYCYNFNIINIIKFIIFMISKKLEKMINHLTNDLYCKLGVSKIHGIGVIAMKDIPKGVNPFESISKKLSNNTTIDIPNNIFNTLSNTIKKYILDFCHKDSDEIYISVPSQGFNNLDISWYLNHSSKNNMNIIYDDNHAYNIFITNRKIKKGEELTINYNKF